MGRVRRGSTLDTSSHLLKQVGYGCAPLLFFSLFSVQAKCRPMISWRTTYIPGLMLLGIVTVRVLLFAISASVPHELSLGWYPSSSILKKSTSLTDVFSSGSNPMCLTTSADNSSIACSTRVANRDDGSLVIAEPRCPLKGDCRTGARYGINSRRDKREMTAGDVWRCYVVNWAGALNNCILLVSPIDTFDPREFAIYSRVIRRIAITVLELTPNEKVSANDLTYVVPSITKLSMIPWAAASEADPTKMKRDRIFLSNSLTPS